MIKIEDLDYIQSCELLHQVRSPQVLWANYPRLLAGQDAATAARIEPSRLDKERTAVARRVGRPPLCLPVSTQPGQPGGRHRHRRPIGRASASKGIVTGIRTKLYEA